ncbi:hypothetical protein WEN_02155 [Mycoplasma wenyonii str. Massachusetts]|uniref:Uncharacterized protein n=1 Tax=Mycoplasma wenyonii (strain Massachusetts) TaxID=1197325 RepID=I6ZJ32_MYCWM|nr:hypothetical protein [Mycoplasma wenyonii]AFN65220.1 hypothetical protein WEN_02155 [Mycoplasma wenyonii str. Massachusetts]
MILAKVLAISVSCTTGLLGSASPLIHIGVTKSDWKNKWYPNKNDFRKAVLWGCKAISDVSANINYKDKLYNIFLEENSQTSESSKISFRVEEVTISSGQKKDVWRSNGTKKEENWDTWKLSRKENTLVLSFPYLNKWQHQVEYALTGCEGSKIIPSDDSSSFGSGELVESSQIQLALSEGDSCRKYLSSVECDITINASGKLKWKEDWQPKITYTAFK